MIVNKGDVIHVPDSPTHYEHTVKILCEAEIRNSYGVLTYKVYDINEDRRQTWLATTDVLSKGNKLSV